jgi:hypothetical protein
MERIIFNKIDNIQGNDQFIFVSLLFIVPEQPFAMEIWQRNRKDWLIDWIKSGFSTTTADDKFTVDFQMMAKSTGFCAKEPAFV